MQYVILKKERFDDFISGFAATQKLVAPVSRGFNRFSFEEVDSGGEIALHYIPTIVPPKKFFMPQSETLMEFDTSPGISVNSILEYEPMGIFGVHTCDLAGIQCLNMVFSERPEDHYYLMRKNAITLIGLECNEYCDRYASCHLVGAHIPNGGYDLLLTDLGSYFLIHMNTVRGEEIIGALNVFEKAESSHINDLTGLRERKMKIFRNEVPIEQKRLPELFDKSFDALVWKDLDERCLACGNCTAVCPTCYCFDIRDDVALDLEKGERYRSWFSCQLEPFAKVAGGINFRKARSARQRHRYYRKFRYSVDKFSRFFCTGCGRCTRTCMADISLIETLNDLIKEKNSNSEWKK